ncbi:MAG: transposase [Parvularculaceae bacterium]|nr:transposase [Parvularculaceae bacterium]
MPNYRRFYADGGTYFLTVCLEDRRSDLLVREIDALRAYWRDVAAARPFETVAAAAMPDQLHVIWRLPDDDHDFPARLSMLKAGFTRRLPDAMKSGGRKGERGVWQARYWEHLIRDDDDLSRHIDYIHWNPVKHGYAASPDDWPSSTWHGWKKEFGRPVSIPPEDWKPVHLGER